jgi:hypothetical protein
MGVRHDAKQAGGGSQAEELYGRAAEVLVIDRLQKNPLQRAFGN